MATADLFDRLRLASGGGAPSSDFDLNPDLHPKGRVLRGAAVLVARTVTVPPGGTAAGAWYRPVADTVPTAALPPATPLTDHATPASPFSTVAVSCAPVPMSRLAGAPEMATVVWAGA